MQPWHVCRTWLRTLRALRGRNLRGIQFERILHALSRWIDNVECSLHVFGQLHWCVPSCTFNDAVVCSPGQFSATGTVPCQPCPVDTFSSSPAATSCTRCPKGFITPTSGATAVSTCYSFLRVGASDNIQDRPNWLQRDRTTFSSCPMWIKPFQNSSD